MKKIISFNGKKIHYKLEGKGKPIVLLHGFLESLEIWDAFVDSLIQDFLIIRIDLPGFGRSEVICEEHSMELMADIVHLILENEKVNSAVIVGHSMGGYTSLAFAERYPRLVSGLCLFHSQAASDTMEAKTNRDRTIKLVEQDRQGFISNFIPDLFAKENVDIFQNEIKKLKVDAVSTKKDGIIAALKGMKSRTDKFEVIRNLNVPVMFIAGKKDKRIPVNIVLEQAGLSSQCEISLFENVGHMGFLEARDETLEFLRAFVNKCYKA